LTVTASTASWNQLTNQTPILTGNFSKNVGKAVRAGSGIVSYFDGIQQVTDPSINNVTNTNTLKSQFSNYAIADSQGQILLTNPVPGQQGNLGLRWIEGPARLGLDVNLKKRMRIAETKEFELRVDVANILNTPQWGNPALDINGSDFGRITTATGTRSFTFHTRFTF